MKLKVKVKDCPKICGIYKITNQIGEIYIGQNTNILKRFYIHKLNYGKLAINVLSLCLVRDLELLNLIIKNRI